MSENRNKEFKGLLLDFFVKNSLSFRVVYQESFRTPIDFLNPNVQEPSRRTLIRDFEEIYQESKEHVFQQLHEYIYNGGRVALTTDYCSAVTGRNI